jgi:hypothetical protein
MVATISESRFAAPRRAFGGIVVGALYMAVLIGAPLLVRYGPEQEMTSAVARVAIDKVATPRCAYAPEFGRSCMHVDATH